MYVLGSMDFSEVVSMFFTGSHHVRTVRASTAIKTFFVLIF